MKQQSTDKNGYAKLKTDKRSVESTIDVHQKGGYRPGWNNSHDTSQKPASTRLTRLCKENTGRWNIKKLIYALLGFVAAVALPLIIYYADEYFRPYKR